jgi:DNA-binding transcriptional MerR regulator
VRATSTFRVQEFAKLAGVTVRALHHYDRLGLLSPAHRSERGYRLYCHDDLGRLERILVLRYLGLSLKEIADLLQQSNAPEPLSATLTRQHAVLRERRAGLDRVLRAIEHAQARAVNSAEPDWPLYQSILKEIQMQQSQNWTDKYYSAEGLDELRERRPAWTPELQADITAKWQALYDDIQSALDHGVAPTSEEGRALASRWKQLAELFTQGSPELTDGLRRLYADRSNWPDNAAAKSAMPKPEHCAFITAAQQES